MASRVSSTRSSLGAPPAPTARGTRPAIPPPRCWHCSTPRRLHRRRPVGEARSVRDSCTTRCSRISTPRLIGLGSDRGWPTTRWARGEPLAAAAVGNGAPAAAQSQQYNTGGSDNADAAATAIDCLDHPVSRDLASYGALAQSLEASAPIFGPLLAWGEAGCAVWPVPPTRPVGPVAAPGAPPILVVGTTNDPATPYVWAVSVAKELDSGVLLTHDGDDHVAYFYSACVRADVQTYLVIGQTPPAGAVCTS